MCSDELGGRYCYRTMRRRISIDRTAARDGANVRVGSRRIFPEWDAGTHDTPRGEAGCPCDDYSEGR